MPTDDGPRGFPVVCVVCVVCVGGSAGGLDAHTRLLSHLPADLGMAIVIVNHVRAVATLLHQILPRFTAMPVRLISDRLRIAPNEVFIIPQGRCRDPHHFFFFASLLPCFLSAMGVSG